MGRTILFVSGGTISLGARLLGVTVVCAAMASCATTSQAPPKKNIRSKEYFSEKEYGVKASPRVVSEGQPVPKGGGRFMVGQPYQVRGKTYIPKEDPDYNRSGLASWYGSAFHGRYTANGEVYDSASLTAAHPTFPLPSYARVTNLQNGSSVIVRVNDRGPYHEGRILDVSSKTAELLDIKRTGTAKVNVQYVGRARMDGQDAPFLMASYIRKGDRLPSFNPDGQIATGVMVASNEPLGDQLQAYGLRLPAPAVATTRTSKPQEASQRGFEASTTQASSAPMPAAAPRTADRPVATATRPPVQQRAMAALAPAPAQQLTQPRAQQAQVRPAVVQPASSTETAYIAPPKGVQPQVMFGNMLLQDPAPAQKPSR
ncbi:septal ring lytic transglycosylase RlpA family protein [Rhizobium deserti]|nr:septal ring lytic transglycosylase RlpA family protein [Rhizobium deserti]